MNKLSRELFLFRADCVNKRKLNAFFSMRIGPQVRTITTTTKTVKILKEVLTREVLVPPREELENFFYGYFN